ncbi:DUF4189 domain-containing protein [uncultured Stenotrophomonas sp.]|uniref:DUF4189 domain-containing protein n=1 Tax=uncultured Stenotrophomonas sp. TaxID=165438 RepID=UPI0028EEE7A7|nr:DUF4189 domain-containing protein [uncultured Stenotrophomonas sp.]
MKKALLVLLLVLSPGLALAEGACPAGSYPIGGQGIQGCAPIPVSGSGEAPRSVPTGKWETRWGAVAEGQNAANPKGPTATGVAVSQKSGKAATQLAIDECKRGGGTRCEVRIAYYNQCVAIADPTHDARESGASLSSIVRAQTEEKAKQMASERCQSTGQRCEIVYSACSMSEFKSFR